MLTSMQAAKWYRHAGGHLSLQVLVAHADALSWAASMRRAWVKGIRRTKRVIRIANFIVGLIIVVELT